MKWIDMVVLYKMPPPSETRHTDKTTNKLSTRVHFVYIRDISPPASHGLKMLQDSRSSMLLTFPCMSSHEAQLTKQTGSHMCGNLYSLVTLGTGQPSITMTSCRLAFSCTAM
jgi:hypothetical protein